MRDMPGPGTVVFVCTSCRAKTIEANEDGIARPGLAMAEALQEKLADDPGIDVRMIDCLAVCKRPCTIALTAEGKWTYIVGDLEQVAEADDVAAMARAYAATDNGIVAWRERPLCFRRGVVARVPPIKLPWDGTST